MISLPSFCSVHLLFFFPTTNGTHGDLFSFLERKTLEMVCFRNRNAPWVLF